MKRKARIGNTVVCRYFNTPEGRFYGDYFEATVIDIDDDTIMLPSLRKPYKVRRSDTGYEIWLHSKEVKRVKY